jgi:UDP-3-O-[3-hydroxymyristoyl] glucosamine N-acyltransferase
MRQACGRLVSTAANALVHPTAVVHPRAVVRAGARVDPNAVIGDDVTVGECAVVGAGASLQNCTIGARAVLHPGARVGQDGFGYTLAAGGHKKKPQTLRVVLGDDVEVGANSCIDRGSWRDTSVGSGTKIDNLVQVGHNAVIGEHCVIASLCGLGGSVTLGDRVYIGAMTGVLQHTSIGAGAKVAAASRVTANVPPGQTYGGHPAVPIRDYHKQTLAIRGAASPSSQSKE